MARNRFPVAMLALVLSPGLCWGAAVERATGALSARAPGALDWSGAGPGYPAGPGTEFAAGQGASAWIALAAGRVALGGGAAARVADEAAIDLTAGEAYVSARAPMAVRTPHGIVRSSSPARFAVSSGPDGALATAIEGAVAVEGARLWQLPPGHASTLTAGAIGAVAPARPSPFAVVMRLSETDPPLAREASDLVRYGVWADTPEHGAVWYPEMPAGWAPYRYGGWRNVEPWGWTWIDGAPWGTAIVGLPIAATIRPRLGARPAGGMARAGRSSSTRRPVPPPRRSTPERFTAGRFTRPRSTRRRSTPRQFRWRRCTRRPSMRGPSSRRRTASSRRMRRRSGRRSRTLGRSTPRYSTRRPPRPSITRRRRPPRRRGRSKRARRRGPPRRRSRASSSSTSGGGPESARQAAPGSPKKKSIRSLAPAIA